MSKTSLPLTGADFFIIFPFLSWQDLKSVIFGQTSVTIGHYMAKSKPKKSSIREELNLSTFCIVSPISIKTNKNKRKQIKTGGGGGDRWQWVKWVNTEEIGWKPITVVQNRSKQVKMVKMGKNVQNVKSVKTD